MSRGLSKQQRRILGIAVGIYDAGAPQCLVDAGFSHVWPSLAMHLIGGLPLTDRATDPRPKDARPVIDPRTPGFHKTQVSLARAFRNLVDRDLLSHERTYFFNGYFLTEEGERAGRPYAERLPDDLALETLKLVREFLVLPGEPYDTRPLPDVSHVKPLELYGSRQEYRKRLHYGTSMLYLVARMKRWDDVRNMLFGAALREEDVGYTGWGLRLPRTVSVVQPDDIRTDNTYQQAAA